MWICFSVCFFHTAETCSDVAHSAGERSCRGKELLKRPSVCGNEIGAIKGIFGV